MTDYEVEKTEVKEETITSEPKKKKSKKRRKAKMTEKPKEKDTIEIQALKNFMLWDGHFVKEGETVEIPKLYAKRLLTHKPQAFKMA